MQPTNTEVSSLSLEGHLAWNQKLQELRDGKIKREEIVRYVEEMLVQAKEDADSDGESFRPLVAVPAWLLPFALAEARRWAGEASGIRV